MLSCNVLESQQSEAAVHPAARTVAGAWKLLPCHAISLRVRQRSVLEIARGRVWLTAQALSGRASVDQVLCAGEQITLERVAAFVAHNALLRTESFEVRSFAVFSSILSPSGAKHRMERRFALG